SIPSNARRSRTLRLLARQNFALVNPALHADDSIRRLSLGEAVIHVRPQRMQRQTALQIPLGTRDFRAIQTSAHPDLDTLRAEPQRRIHGLSHRAPKRDSFFKLHRDSAGNKLRVELGPMNLLDIDVDLSIGPLLDVSFQFVDFRTLAADDDARPRRVDRDAELVRHALDFDIADAGVCQLFEQIALQLQIFVKQPAVIAFGEPSRTPWFRDSETESIRVCFLTHYCLSPSSIVICDVRR